VSQSNAKAIAELPSRSRSRLTNGATLLGGVNGKSAEARRYRDLYLAFVAEAGGDAVVTEAERALCRQAAALTLRSERLQAAIVRGEAVDDEQIVRITNSAARALSALRRRRSKPRAPGSSLADYLAGKAAGEVAA
jgi:hypothetical protein